MQAEMQTMEPRQQKNSHSTTHITRCHNHLHGRTDSPPLHQHLRLMKRPVEHCKGMSAPALTRRAVELDHRAAHKRLNEGPKTGLATSRPRHRPVPRDTMQHSMPGCQLLVHNITNRHAG